MQDVYPVEIEFRKGEQPSATKLTGTTKQTETAFEKVTEAVGDPWVTTGHSGTGGAFELSPEKLAQTSLARISGPSDYLSPAGASSEDTTTMEVILRAGRTSWCLGVPIVKRDGNYIGPNTLVDDVFNEEPLVLTGTDDAFDPAKLKATLEEVNEEGAYHVDYYTGTVTSYLPSTADTTWTLTGSFFPSGLPWGTANVIPTWVETGALCGIVLDGIASGGQQNYTCTLPVVQNQPRVEASTLLGGRRKHVSGTGSDTLSDVAFIVPALGADKEYRLPISLVQNLTANDPIPEGFILLWDNAAGRVVPLVTFTYEDEKSITITAPEGTLATGDETYRLLVTGASLAETVGYLSSVVRDNRHIGLTDGSSNVGTLSYTTPVSHDDLVDLYSYETPSVSSRPEALLFCKSTLPTNPHPQYIHRYGWREEDTVGNSGNAMRGDLVFTGTDSELSVGSPQYSGETTSTFGICFGGGIRTGRFASSRLSAEGGFLNTVESRFSYNNAALGAILEDNFNFGAVVHSGSKGVPFHLRGALATVISDAEEYTGAVLGFDMGHSYEMNYVKLLPGIRGAVYDGDVANDPANTGQSQWGTALDITPSLSSRFSSKQIREFRFRGAPIVSSAVNDSSIYDTGENELTGAGEGFEKTFTSPGMVGADFFNVYSNAIFFSDTGDGKRTSFTDAGENWLDGNSSQDLPTGLYYRPDSPGSPYEKPIGFEFRCRWATGSSTTLDTIVARFGPDNASVFADTTITLETGFDASEVIELSSQSIILHPGIVNVGAIYLDGIHGRALATAGSGGKSVYIDSDGRLYAP